MYPDYDNAFMSSCYREAPDTLCPMVYMFPYMPPFAEFDDDNDDTDMMRQPPYSTARLLQLFEAQSPQSFTQLERYRVPRFFLRRIFRAVIGFVQRNVNVNEPLPQPVNQYAEVLFRRMISRQPMFTNVFTFFGVPANVTRNVMLTLIRFVLNNMSFPGTTGAEGAVDRIVRLVLTTTNVAKDLAAFKVTENEARTLITSIARYVVQNAGTTPPANIEAKVNELTNLVIRNTTVDNTMTSKGIPAGQVRNIIRAVVLVALREKFNL